MLEHSLAHEPPVAARARVVKACVRRVIVERLIVATIVEGVVEEDGGAAKGHDGEVRCYQDREDAAEFEGDAARELEDEAVSSYHVV